MSYQYELTCIVDPHLGEDGTNEVIEKVKDLITTQEGEVKSVKTWGRRRLAYEINDKTEGVYVTMTFASRAEGCDEVRRLASYDERILRTLFVREN